jgi:glutamine---fructose-6-phosphate transaminase (isomerizing)
MQELANIPQTMDASLRRDPQCEELAHQFVRTIDFLYLGRGIHYPTALEGALKRKEIS